MTMQTKTPGGDNVSFQKEASHPSNTNPHSPFHLKIKLEKGPQCMTKLTNKLTQLQETNDKLKDFNMKKSGIVTAKDNEIDHLNEDIDKVILANYDLNMEIEKEIQERNDLEYEQKRIAAFINDIKKKFSNVEKTISDYEATFEHIKKENLVLQDTYEKKIDQIEKENRRIADRIDDRIDIFNRQMRVISETESAGNKLVQEIEDQKNFFSERQMLSKIRYDEHERKFSQLQKKICELQMNEEIRQVENTRQERRMSSSQALTSELGVQLMRYEEDNENLSSQIIDLSRQWNDITARSSFKESTERSKGNSTVRQFKKSKY